MAIIRKFLAKRRAKKDLRKANLILIDRSTYFLYIGSSKIGASKVKENWEKYERL
jgi:hypothetical protein